MWYTDCAALPILQACKKPKEAETVNIWHDISESRITPEDFIACIEISKGGKNKYELDKETGMLILDRVLYTATHYPANYGFIPRTYAGDGDPLDVLVLCQESILPLTLVRCYPIGMIRMVDGESKDEKIIAIPMRDPSMNCYRDISGLPRHQLDEFSHFFEVYKMLENKKTKVTEMCGREEAVTVIEDCIAAYRLKFSNAEK
jgi:inorganic pyrophosphatase